MGSALDWCVIFFFNLKNNTLLGGDGVVVDLGGVRDKYDQSTLYDVLCRLPFSSSVMIDVHMVNNS